MVNKSMLDRTSTATAVRTNPHEIALQLLCKQLLKSRLFRGFYVERRYVENVHGYRDIVSLQKSENKLNKMLLDIKDKLQLFYSHQNPNMWIGITSGTLTGISTPQPAALETHLWVEMKDLAFGQYWFNIKSIRFRDNEIVLKLKEVQPVEEEETPKWVPNIGSNLEISDETNNTLESSTTSSQAATTNMPVQENQITFDDFLLLLQQWWTTIKKTVYDFMAHDISKDNIKSTLKFFGLLIASIISSAIVGVKVLGGLTIRFMFELSRLLQISTPIIVKLIELFNKIVGGFYILLTMIWKDTVGNRNQPKYQALEYNHPMYKSIHYDVRQRRHGSSGGYNRVFQ